MRLPIADCQLPIANSAARSCFVRGCHDGGQIIRFLKQCRELLGGDGPGFSKQFEPQSGFVRLLLLNGSNLCDEFSFAAGAAGRAVIRRYLSATANNLFGCDASRIIGFGNAPRQFDDAKRESFGALFQFSRVHARKLLNQLAIANRKSTISK